MICYEYRYSHRVYIRRPTMGGMDSEPSHSEVQSHVFRIIVPDASFEPVALHAVKFYAGNERDNDFKILEIKSYSINQIIDSRTR